MTALLIYVYDDGAMYRILVRLDYGSRITTGYGFLDSIELLVAYPLPHSS